MDTISKNLGNIDPEKSISRTTSVKCLDIESYWMTCTSTAVHAIPTRSYSASIGASTGERSGERAGQGSS